MTTTPQSALLSRMDVYLSGKSCEATAIIKDARDLLAKLQATQAEPVQEGELPALPHDGWPARFRCDSCDGNGEIGELISMGHFQPPERQTCPDCGGRGWSDEGPAFNADHMRDYARAALSARKPLNSAQIRGMAIQEQFLLVCDSLEDLTCIVREVERAHGMEVKP